MTDLSVNREALAEFCQRHGILRISLFGSALRPDFDEKSDIDLLYEPEPGVAFSFFELARMERELAELFGNHPIDLRSAQDLSPYFRDDVLAQAVEQYAATG